MVIKMEIMKFSLGSLQSNCYIIHKNKRAFIIDPGFESTDVIDFIKTNELIVKAIYLTHGHFDHVGGVKQLKQSFDLLVYAPMKDKSWFTQGPYNNFGYDIPVDKWVKNLDELIFLDEKFIVYETPGHSAGSTVLHYDSVLFSGDTLFFQSIGRTDIPFGNREEIYHSVKKIYSIFPDETIVYPGHGRATTIIHEKLNNPFVRS